MGLNIKQTHIPTKEGGYPLPHKGRGIKGVKSKKPQIRGGVPLHTKGEGEGGDPSHKGRGQHKRGGSPRNTRG
ncbi:hypothetical protein BK007_06930 [Methanobacterium subterraneum]|uniref:Uncharacterized protein n=1 Tax=Methanobacterium subterraneum TaxID=59277 RepID=A0A2H4VCE6_9EURY|nr:hypothetical protein BK007_06930 [Methanobacterium subterraneum]